MRPSFKVSQEERDLDEVLQKEKKKKKERALYDYMKSLSKIK